MLYPLSHQGILHMSWSSHKYIWGHLVAQSEKAMATHSSTLAWRIPWMEEPCGLQSMGLRRVDTTERLHFHFSLSCTGEGNGNPLQYSCLENPRDRGAWWTAVYGVAQSRTRLKRLSSSSSSGSVAKYPPATQEMKMWIWSLSQEDPLEEEMATHSSILAWRTPWTEEPGGLHSQG